MKHMPWDHALKVTGDGTGLVGHAGAVLLRKAADQAGLTAWLGAALREKGTSPLFDRGIVLVSMAAAIALGATSRAISRCWRTWLRCSGRRRAGRRCAARWTWPAARRCWTGSPAARAKARAHVWTLIEGTAAGFPWLVIAGKALAGWVVIDMDATLITAYSDKEGAAPTWKKG